MPRLSPLPLPSIAPVPAAPVPATHVPAAVLAAAVLAAALLGGCLGAEPQPVHRPGPGADTGPDGAAPGAAGPPPDSGAPLEPDRPSVWACAGGCDPGRDLAGDCDADGLLNRDELSLAGRRGPAWTDPCAADGDGDGLPDGEELAWGLLPFDPDSDGDGAGDAWAVQMARTAAGGARPAAVSPHPPPPMADGDGDGIPTMAEACVGADPARADTDGDGLPDGEDLWRGCDPRRPDTDGDGWSDGAEIAAGSSCRHRGDAPRGGEPPR